MREFISVIENIGGLPVAGNRDWTVNSILESKLVYWMGGTTRVCQRDGREFTLVLQQGADGKL